MTELWDTSALILAARDTGAAVELADALAADEVAISEPILLEYLNGARNLDEYRRFAEALGATQVLATKPETWRRALEVHGLLAESGAGHQRSVRLVDLIVAAVAEEHAYAVVHCDEDYERIARLTGQQTRWIGPRLRLSEQLGAYAGDEAGRSTHRRSLAGALRDKVKPVSDDEAWETIREKAELTPDPDRAR